MCSVSDVLFSCVFMFLLFVSLSIRLSVCLFVRLSLTDGGKVILHQLGIQGFRAT